nr:acyl-CoA synthetase [Micromonospora sp. DSM 115978]
HPDHGEQPVAVVELAPGAAGTAEELITVCAGRVARYKWPRSVEVVDRLPVNPMGKIEKRRLRDPHWRGHDRAI